MKSDRQKSEELEISEGSKICAKCGHENPHGVDMCQACSAHLQLVCKKCHHRNPRSRYNCEKCGQRIRTSRWKKLRRALMGREGKIKPMEIILAIVMIAIFYKLSMMLVGYMTNTTPGAVQ